MDFGLFAKLSFFVYARKDLGILDTNFKFKFYGREIFCTKDRAEMAKALG
jgi:hypothetical protein